MRMNLPNSILEKYGNSKEEPYEADCDSTVTEDIPAEDNTGNIGFFYYKKDPPAR